MWAIQKHRLESQIPLLTYREMAWLLTLWRQSEDYTFLKSGNAQAQQQILMALDRAIWDVLARRKPGARLPRFKKKAARRDTARFPQAVEVTGDRVRLPSLG